MTGCRRFGSDLYGSGQDGSQTVRFIFGSVPAVLQEVAVRFCSHGAGF